MPTNDLGMRVAWQKLQFMGGPHLRQQYASQNLLLNLKPIIMNGAKKWGEGKSQS